MSAAYRDSSGKGLVCGIGIYEPRILCMADSPDARRAYHMWNGMLRRTEPKYAEKFPTYAGSSVAESFHRFASFADWVMQQPGWSCGDYQLDKDLITKGNKVYSPENCVLLPKPVNVLLTRGNKSRGLLPIGVKGFRHTQFAARIKIDGVDKSLGIFKTIDGAFAAYKASKEANIKRIAAAYKDHIDQRAYAALLAYEVEITD